MLVVACAVWVVALVWLVAAFRALRSAAVPAPRPGEGAEALSVVVAAHDEAPRIGGLLRSLLAQDHPDFEVIVVDDRSRDGTGAAARCAAAGDPRVRVLRVEERPAGWQGRLHAQGVGAAAARGTWLLFLSADQRLEGADFLRALVALYARRDAAAVSVVGPFVGDRWWERWLFHPLLDHPLFWGTLFGVQRLRPRATWLIGALGLHRDTYAALGGALGASHCAAGGFDDWGWARACAQAGLRTRMAYHAGLLDVSNWGGFRAFWDGLARWEAGLFTYRRAGWLAAAGIAATVACLLACAVAVAAAWLRGHAAAPAALVAATVVPLVGLAYCRWSGRPWPVALTFFPVGAFLIASLAGAAWARLRNRVRWREEVMAVVAPPPDVPGGARRQVSRPSGVTERRLHVPV
jgi:hypothetical protein